MSGKVTLGNELGELLVHLKNVRACENPVFLKCILHDSLNLDEFGVLRMQFSKLNDDFDKRLGAIIIRHVVEVDEPMNNPVYIDNFFRRVE
eukprot:CAMPEP_0171555094 /NCGR_PEP_ID=MMETSP0960-20121227/9924_1 /TAXON_ID=87120 /ORGANISM="Aurantiochytrium limacinum, Strain ATCCMYA-1381" /LENGTH=90 /DNA_ID=CAMNT_0012105093 /DNA_START=1244 /DNA_END=1516 /DNA_ORIENTATION=+